MPDRHASRGLYAQPADLGSGTAAWLLTSVGPRPQTRSPREVLAARAVQPGHVRSWTTAEQQLAVLARALLPATYAVSVHPRDLQHWYHRDTADTGRSSGLIPDLKITDLLTGNYLFVEVKRQGGMGNAQERMYKPYTAKFVTELAGYTGLNYHPFVTVLCDNLATDGRYRRQITAHVPDGQLLFWTGYDVAGLARYLDRVRDGFLDPDRFTLTRCIRRIPVAHRALTAAGLHRGGPDAGR